ncbi:hypothetical protein HBH64_161330 [Parastagonospora nodorum]|nr:hypothetical protein HBH49_041450 [Parastagonospora nodorum]KAH4076719.1 hypothetical protein HBH50_009450 [Parastagonospora nodorum]KAH4095798.1 hypothetical protein HBH48_048310 [Parastagonospora nodorum]KAH4197550.1 hypothetical protein HBH42_058780 [Parastagonospora nodorum]KAH4259395.1 hypothetical protein HBI03_134310 [Parastagonospora nodorum]
MQFSSLLLLLLGASSTTCALDFSDFPIRRAGAGPPPAAPAAPRPASPPSVPAAPRPATPPSAPRPPKPDRPDAPDSPDTPDDDRTDNGSTTRISRPSTSIVRIGTQISSRTTIQSSTSTTSAFRTINTGAGSRVYVDSGIMVLISVVVAAVA